MTRVCAESVHGHSLACENQSPEIYVSVWRDEPRTTIVRASSPFSCDHFNMLSRRIDLKRGGGAEIKRLLSRGNW